MGNLRKFQEYIESPLSVDYWSDEGLDESLLMARHFGADDWSAIEKEWSHWNNTAQVRLAELLSECKAFKTERTNILEAMLLSECSDLVEAATDSLSQ